MKKAWEKHNNFNRHNGKKEVFYILSFLLGTIAIVYLAVTIIGAEGSSSDREETKGVSSEIESDANLSEEISNGNESKQGEADTLAEDYEKASSNEPVNNESADSEVVSSEDSLTENTKSTDSDFSEAEALSSELVDKEAIEDKEDPEQYSQQEEAKGAEIDVSKLETSKDQGNEITTYGIDVAKWQGVIDWKKVKEAGVEFAMIRIGYRTQVTGDIHEDPYAKYNLQQALANDIKLGVYFFSTAINEQEAKEEAKWVTDYIAPYPITYPVAYNCEGFTDINNRQYGMSKVDRTNMAIEFLDYIENKGYTPMFYASKNELEQSAQWNADTLSKKYMIWVAQYSEVQYSASAMSSYSGPHDMWQYTSNGKVLGIKNAVDINIAYFGYEVVAKAKSNTPQETAEADPAALISFTEVEETVTAKKETNLRTVPNTETNETVVAVLKNGDTAVRIGIGNNGWSKVEYKGRILYAVSSFLTTEQDSQETKLPEEQMSKPTYKEVKEQVTAKEETNLRSEPDTEKAETVVTVLRYGEVVTRTGIGDNGWSRVEYKEQTLYAKTSFLTTDLDYKSNNSPSLENPEAGITFTEVQDKVTAKKVTNLRLVPSTEIADTIVTALNNGEVVLRTGIGSNGWSRIVYEDLTVYAVTSYLMVVKEE